MNDESGHGFIAELTISDCVKDRRGLLKTPNSRLARS
jgi:hypothetical protein